MKPYLFIFILFFCVAACHDNSHRRNYEAATLSILGKTVPVIDSLYQKNINQEHIILLCSPYDCSPCLEAAFDELKLMTSKSELIQCTVIGLLSDPSCLQERYAYYDYILFDGEDVVRKALKYVPTPVFIVCDKNNKVIACHFPVGTDDRYKIASSLLK